MFLIPRASVPDTRCDGIIALVIHRLLASDRHPFEAVFLIPRWFLYKHLKKNKSHSDGAFANGLSGTGHLSAISAVVLAYPAIERRLVVLRGSRGVRIKPFVEVSL